MDQDERFDVYIGSLEAELPDWLAGLERRAAADGIPIVRKQTQSLLRMLLVLKKPERILEIGTAVGFSAPFFSGYAPAGWRSNTIEKK